MIGARKPMLLALFEALIAMAARDNQAIIFLIIEMTNVDLQDFRILTISRINNGKSITTHDQKARDDYRRGELF